MPALSGIVETDGEHVRVEIGLGRSSTRQLRMEGHPVPAKVTLRALLDTGAECSCVDPRAVASLAFPVKNVNVANIPAIGGLTPVFELIACLTVIHPTRDHRLNLVIHDLQMAEVSLAGLGYQALIGRDALKKCRLLYDGPGARFRLSY